MKAIIMNGDGSMGSVAITSQNIMNVINIDLYEVHVLGLYAFVSLVETN